MITSVQLTSTGDELVYSSSGTNAITTIIICNTGTPDLSDETVNSSTLTLNLTSSAPNNVSTDANTIVKNLIVPAGETVFLSEERVILDNGNQLRATASSANLLSITVSTLPV
jgi:hypothetical protein